jgi:hypothetical protein
MKDPQERRTRWVNTRFTASEYEQLQRSFKKTTCKDMGQYMRNCVFHKPVFIKTRNESTDDFLADMVVLRQELNAIGRNFNQAVHRLHTLDFVPEIQQWIMVNEQDKTILFRKIEEILNRVIQLHSIWSHE